MCSAPVPCQSLGDRCLSVCAPPIAVAGQTLGIARACADGVDNLHPRLPMHSADARSQCAVPLRQGFLPLLHGSRGHGHKPTALPAGAAQHADLLLGTTGPLAQTRGVELLEPLAILHVRRAPGHLARVMGIDQRALNPTLVEPFDQGHPVDPGGLQHDGINLTLP